MPRHQEVNKLFNKLSHTVNGTDPASRFDHYLLPDHDLAAYRSGRAWPGDTYILMGNSFNLELGKDLEERSSVLAKLFSEAKDQQCLEVSDAVKNESFVSVLSRFERDWLSRLPKDSMIGPAFDINGSSIPEAFSAWQSVKSVLRTPVTA